MLVLIGNGENKFEIWNSNPFHERLELQMTYAIGESSMFENNSHIFNSLKDFGKSKLNIGIMPAGHFLIKNLEDDAYWGFEIDLLLDVEKLLNFEHVFVNSSYDWGFIGEDGFWSGLQALVKNGGADLVGFQNYMQLNVM